MSGWLFLGIGLFAAILDFAAGYYLLRRGSPVEGLTLDTPDSARVGRLILFMSPLFLFVFALLAFGVIPLESIEPISLGGGQ